MSNSNIRFNEAPYDVIDKKAKWVNMSVDKSKARFEIENGNNVAGLFRHNGYIFNAEENLSVKFDKNFTVVFWAKCPQKALTDNVYKNNLVLCLDSSNIITADISSIDVTEWHQYSIVRDENSDIKISVDGTSVQTANNSTSLDLTGNSFIYFGSINQSATGYDVIADDILLFDGSLDFSTTSAEYLKSNNYKKCLYIKVETGEVWGYAKG